MAKRSFTYRFKASAINEGYDHLFRKEEVIYTFSQEVEKFVECNNRTFVIKREDVPPTHPTDFKKNIDVLRYKLRYIVKDYLNSCGVDKQDTCIVEYELLRANTFSTNEFISDNLRTDVKFMVNAIKAIGDNTLINPIEQIKEMRFEIPLNYVSSEIFYIRYVRETSDSQENARKYLKKFITAFFRLIPQDVIEKYDTLLGQREKEWAKRKKHNKERHNKERRELLPATGYDRAAFHYVSSLIKDPFKGSIVWEIGKIISDVYRGQSFCFLSFANWKKVIVAFLEIDEKSTKYEDSKTQSSILNEISNEQYIKEVERFLFIIDKYYHIRDIKQSQDASAIFFKFLTVCPSKYLNDKYKRRDPDTRTAKEFKKSEFKNLCLQYFGLETNQYKPNDCEKILKTKFNSYEDNLNVWDKIRPPKKD